MNINIGKAAAIGLLVVGAACANAQQPPPAGERPPPLVMTIPAFADGTTVPVKFTCLGGDASMSPEIRWSQAPAGTQSFLLMLVDLESHPNKGMLPFAHWILWDIPATATGLPEGLPSGVTLADGTHQMNGRKGWNYLGPCALPGPNGHYLFTLYALNTTLNLPVDAQRDDFMKAAEGHVLGAANWLGLFHR